MYRHWTNDDLVPEHNIIMMISPWHLFYFPHAALCQRRVDWGDFSSKAVFCYLNYAP